MDQDIARVDPIIWLQERHLPEVVAISQQCYEEPWTLDQFQIARKSKNIVGMVYVGQNLDGSVQGYMFYEMRKHKLSIINFGVGIPYRRKYVGTCMIERLKNKLNTQKRTRIEFDAHESHLNTHVFLRANAFTAIAVNRGQFGFDDGYTFIFDVDKPLDDRLPTQNEFMEV